MGHYFPNIPYFLTAALMILKHPKKKKNTNVFVKNLKISNIVVRAFAHGAIGRRIDPSWGGPIELFLVPASAPRSGFSLITLAT